MITQVKWLRLQILCNKRNYFTCCFIYLVLNKNFNKQAGIEAGDKTLHLTGLKAIIRNFERTFANRIWKILKILSMNVLRGMFALRNPCIACLRQKCLGFAFVIQKTILKQRIIYRKVL